MKRGFPATHCFAQARLVFEVAKSRCHEVFDRPGGMTLWSLPAEIENRFDELWQGWLDESEKWTPVFQSIQGETGEDLLRSLRTFDLLSPPQLEAVSKLRRSAGNHSVRIDSTDQPLDDIFTLLAAGFVQGEVGSPTIPYLVLET